MNKAVIPILCVIVGTSFILIITEYVAIQQILDTENMMFKIMNSLSHRISLLENTNGTDKITTNQYCSKLFDELALKSPYPNTKYENVLYILGKLADQDINKTVNPTLTDFRIHCMNSTGVTP